MSKFAAIDVGTNTILMLVADIAADGSFTVLNDRGEIPRLGQGVDQTRSLSSAGMERAVAVLRDYMRDCRQSGLDEVAVVGTSALRDAVNAKTFAERLKRELKLDLRVLSGAEEAAYSYLSVRKGLNVDAPQVLVVDVGGGSTEFIWAKDGRLQGWASIDVGAVRLTERHFHSDPVLPDECARLVSAVDQSLAKVLADWGGKISAPVMVGIAGTFTTMAAVQKGLRHYSHSEVHGFRLRRAEIERQAALYRSKTVAERKQIAGLEPMRADVILAGALLTERVLNLFALDEVIVSDQGIRYGLLYEKIGNRLSAAGNQQRKKS
ncbi:MAG TPA: Ppx/GppA phosphatase family protein [Candidatus Binatia bacterium]|jgi:exopolyphosphatase/guanosine-5'-triphosphate,3'-diphosphate pyrophosphatase